MSDFVCYEPIRADGKNQIKTDASGCRISAVFEQRILHEMHGFQNTLIFTWQVKKSRILRKIRRIFSSQEKSDRKSKLFLKPCISLQSGGSRKLWFSRNRWKNQRISEKSRLFKCYVPSKGCREGNRRRLAIPQESSDYVCYTPFWAEQKIRPWISAVSSASRKCVSWLRMLPDNSLIPCATSQLCRAKKSDKNKTIGSRINAVSECPFFDSLCY